MTAYAPGNFCWNELATTNPASAKAFYSELFGWQVRDEEYAPGMLYTTFELAGKAVGAAYGLSPAELEKGIPPHWNVYISVASADESAAKAESLGGKVVMAPFDVMHVGRMAVVQDPTGAMFCLWEGKAHIGAAVVGEDNAFCWWELNTKNPAAAKAFYTELFGWEIGGDEHYPEWKSGGISVGGMMEIQPEWGPVPPHWLPYVMVTDCDATAEKAKALGGHLPASIMDIEGMGRFAVIGDMEDAAFAIFQLKK